MSLFSIVENTAFDDDCLISSVNLFHSLGPACATEYALSPYVFRLAAGSSSNLIIIIIILL